MDRIKIAYIIDALDIGGSEKQIYEIAKRLEKNTFEPIVYCLSRKGNLFSKLKKEGIQVELIGPEDPVKKIFIISKIFTLIRIMRRLKRLYFFIKKEKPSIIQGYLFWDYILGAIVGKMDRVPIILSCRRSLTSFPGNKFYYPWLRRITKSFNTLIIANSQAVKADVIAHEKLDAEKVEVIYNGIDLEKYQDSQIDKKAKKGELGLSEKDKVVGVIANLHTYKGHSYFIEAAHLVKDKFPQTKFILIGDGPEKERLRKQAESLSLKEDVLFLGLREDVPEILQIMDLSVLPSFGEGFSNTILESMACSVPVVATRVGGNPEAVIDGQTGFLVPPRNSASLAQAIIRLLEDEELREEMGRASREYVEQNFSMERLIEETEKTYERLIRWGRERNDRE